MSDTSEVLLDAPAAPARSRGRVIAGIIAAVAVVAGAAFAAVSLGDSGANSPEDPVRAMVAAAQKGDVLGVMAELDPGERDALRGPLADLVLQLNRLDVLKDAHLDHLTGVDLQIKDLDLATDKVDDGLAHVRITKGTSQYSVDPAQLPLGGFVRDLAGNNLNSAKSSGTGQLISKTKTDFVTTVKRGNHWYVSIGYSLAEVARIDAGKSRADLGAGVPANGAGTPEQAVRDIITAGTKLDVRRLIELLPPDELGAVHDYAALFLGDVEQGAQDARNQFSISIPTLELDSSTSGDQATVKIRRLAVSATFGDASFAYADGCIDIKAPAGPGGAGQSKHLCNLKDPTQLMSSFGMPAADLKPPSLSFADKKPDIGIVTTKVDGKWYVSPTRTTLVGLVKMLALFQPQDLTAMRDYFTNLMDSFSRSASVTASDQLTVEGTPLLRSSTSPPTTALGN